MRSLLFVAAALSLLGASAGPAEAQDSTQTISTCTLVIDAQYNDDRSRDRQCVGAVKEFLDAIGAPSAATDSQVSDLVIALTELYRVDDDCKIATTELPEAIALAAAAVVDAQLATDLGDIGQQIESCEFEPTQAINEIPASPIGPGGA